MGLFGGGFTKPGPGIDKNAPKKKGIFLYFEIFFRKFWKLMQLNMIYFLFCLPLFLLVYFFAPISSDFIARISEGFTTNPDELQVLQSSLMLTLRMMASLGVVTFFGFGVAAPGYSYFDVLQTKRRLSCSAIFGTISRQISSMGLYLR